jgi:Ca-activated chloride channel homolog
MIKWVCAFFILLFGVNSKAQLDHDGLIIHRTASNFGVVDFWVSRVDSFLVTNSTNSTIYILKQMVPRDFEFRASSLGIAPGVTSVLEVIYDPRDLGKFKKRLKLYHSASKRPFYLNFQGTVKSYDSFAKMACPSFSSPSYQKQNFNMVVNVIDSLTKEPINKALVELSKGENFQQFYTDKDGSLSRKSHLGLFFIYIEAVGYNSKKVEHYFNKQRREITITLVKKEIIIPPAELIVIEEKKLIVEDTLEILTVEELAPTKQKVVQFKEENNDFPLMKFSENNIVFLIDVSSSMRGEDRLALLKKSMIQLIYMLRSVDKVTIITYSDEAQVVLSSTSAKKNEDIISVITGLKASGSTYGGKAIRKAYKVLKQEFLIGGNNQVILATDGGFNGLGQSERQLNGLVRRKADQGLFFSTLAFGKNKRGKELIEKLSVSGRGNYLYITSEASSKKVLSEMIMLQSAR